MYNADFKMKLRKFKADRLDGSAVSLSSRLQKFKEAKRARHYDAAEARYSVRDAIVQRSARCSASAAEPYELTVDFFKHRMLFWIGSD